MSRKTLLTVQAAGVILGVLLVWVTRLDNYAVAFLITTLGQLGLTGGGVEAQRTDVRGMALGGLFVLALGLQRWLR